MCQGAIDVAEMEKAEPACKSFAIALAPPPAYLSRDSIGADLAEPCSTVTALAERSLYCFPDPGISFSAITETRRLIWISARTDACLHTHYKPPRRLLSSPRQELRQSRPHTLDPLVSRPSELHTLESTDR